MEVMKWLKPSISVSGIGDSASVQAASAGYFRHSLVTWNGLAEVA
jgi:hypothetical protein